MTHSPAGSAECKLHVALPDITRHCNRKLLPKKAAPSLGKSLAVEAQWIDNIYTAAYCIPSTRPFVYSEAVRQSIHEPKDGYPDPRDCADLRLRVISLSLAWQQSVATRSASNQLVSL